VSNHPTAVADVGKVDAGMADTAAGMVDTAEGIDAVVMWVGRNYDDDDNDHLVAYGPCCQTI